MYICMYICIYTCICISRFPTISFHSVFYFILADVSQLFPILISFLCRKLPLFKHKRPPVFEEKYFIEYITPKSVLKTIPVVCQLESD